MAITLDQQVPNPQNNTQEKELQDAIEAQKRLRATLGPNYAQFGGATADARVKKAQEAMNYNFGGSPGAAQGMVNQVQNFRNMVQNRAPVQANFTQANANLNANVPVQNQAVDLARQAALGQTPSAAQIQQQQGIEQAIAAAQSIGAGAAGGGANAAAAQRQAALQGAGLSQAAVNQNALLRAQEMAQGRQQLGELSGMARGQDIGTAGLLGGQAQSNAGNLLQSYQLGDTSQLNANNQLLNLGEYQGNAAVRGPEFAQQQALQKYIADLQASQQDKTRNMGLVQSIMGGGGQALGALLPLLFSDERLKKDVKSAEKRGAIEPQQAAQIGAAAGYAVPKGFRETQLPSGETIEVPRGTSVTSHPGGEYELQRGKAAPLYMSGQGQQLPQYRQQVLDNGEIIEVPRYANVAQNPQAGYYSVTGSGGHVQTYPTAPVQVGQAQPMAAQGLMANAPMVSRPAATLAYAPTVQRPAAVISSEKQKKDISLAPGTEDFDKTAPKTEEASAGPSPLQIGGRTLEGFGKGVANVTSPQMQSISVPQGPAPLELQAPMMPQPVILSDEKLKDFAGKMEPSTYRYKWEDDSMPKRLGVMAQDVEKSDIGKDIVVDTPAGKGLDINRALSAALATIASQEKRLRSLEKK